LAIALLNGESPTADKALADGTPYIAVTPNSVGPDAVKDVVAAGDANYDDVCTEAVMAACEEFGVTA
jgi:D-xylose transport system substrate-binding protein